MRNADFSIDEEGAEDLLIEIEKQIKSRQWGEVIRLEVEASINKKLLAILKKNLGVSFVVVAITDIIKNGSYFEFKCLNFKWI